MAMPGTIIVGLTSSSVPDSSGGDADVHPFHNDTSSADDDSSSSSAHVGWIIILVLVALAFGMFLCLAAWLEKRRLGASRAARRVVPTQTRPTKKPISERYLEIEKWLVSKRVEDHDETCENALSCGLFREGRKSDDDDNAEKANRQRSLTECTSKTDHSQSSEDVEEGHRDECPICFDVFQPGEIVSWSPEPKCQHVFHHHCIKEWLLKKKECPFCREIFLPIDRIAINQESMKNHRKAIHELILAQQRRSVHCFYCVQHGVVRPSRSFCRMNECQVVDAIRERSECVPTLEDLQEIRGVVDFDPNNASLHSVPRATALSSVDENSDIELCQHDEMEDMSPVDEDADHPAFDERDMQTNSSHADHDVAPFCLDEEEVSDIFPTAAAPEDV